jgi:hypothetical protein
MVSADLHSQLNFNFLQEKGKQASCKRVYCLIFHVQNLLRLSRVNGAILQFRGADIRVERQVCKFIPFMLGGSKHHGTFSHCLLDKAGGVDTDHNS